MLTAALFFLVGACSSEAPPAKPGHGPGAQGPRGGPGGPGGPGPGGAGPGGTPGGAGGSLVLPVDNPAWDALHGLLNNPQEYGEANWDDVRMRVVGHLALLGRDRARLAAMAGDWAGCAARYAESAEAVAAVQVSGEVGPPIRDALATAARRDAGLCDALARGVEPAPSITGTIAPLRARWVGLVVRGAQGKDVRPDAAALAADARAVMAPAGLELDAFGDFEARHKLRVKLVEAWADAVSPFSPTEPFDYWTANEIVRQGAGLSTAAAAVEGGAKPVAAAPESLPPAQHLPYSAEELGALVTGDSTVDTLGFAGPKAIGTLARLGADDPEHIQWLRDTASVLEGSTPGEVPTKVAGYAAELDRFPGGIRYYAIKQLKNSAVRHLARAGRYQEALMVLTTNRPLHNQDWACPDRAAILTTIEGRLRVLAHDPAAGTTLDAGLHEVQEFLAHVAEAEATGAHGARP